jgi:PAB1-binding protein PBP1
MFLKDPYFKGASAQQSQSQTQVVERKRAAGEEIGTISNLSNKAQTIISVRQFTVYSKAGKVL